MRDRTVAEQWMSAITRASLRTTLMVLAVVGSIYAVRRLEPVIITLFVAGILAYVMRPMAGAMVRARWFRVIHEDSLGALVLALVPRSRWKGRTPSVSEHALRVIATLYVLVLMCVGGWYSGKYLVNPFVTEIRNVQENWPEYRAELMSASRDLRAWYAKYLRYEHRRWIEEQVAIGAERSGLAEQATSWFRDAFRRTGEIAKHVVEIVLLPVLAFYFAIESKRLKKEAVGTLPRRYHSEVLRMIREFNQIMFSYVVGQAILCLIAGVVVGILLAVLGVRYPLTLGILAGVTRAIPIIGPIIGGIPIVLLTLAAQGIGTAVGVLIAFTVLHFVESKFIMPLLLGERLCLHPVVIIVVLLIGQEFGGLLGMFLAAPIAALLRVVVRRYWIHRRLGAQVTARG